MKAKIYNPCPPIMGSGTLYLGEPTAENKLCDVINESKKRLESVIKTGRTPAEFYNRVVNPKKKKEEPPAPIIPASIAKVIIEHNEQEIKLLKNGRY